MQYTTDLTGQSGWNYWGTDVGEGVSFVVPVPLLIVAGLGNDTMVGYDPSLGYWIVDSWEGLVVGGGDDVFIGASGNDTLAGEDGNDSLTGNAGNDQIVGGADNDSVFGGVDNDSVFGGDGNDLLEGNQGSDLIYGGAGDDTLGGLVGDDSLYGGEGTDVYRINSLADVVSDDGTTGWDVIFTRMISVDLANYSGIEDVTLRGTSALSATGNAESNELNGNAGANVLSGLVGHDILRGGFGDDSLYGGEGEDWMQGNAGADVLDGGLGADTLVGGYGRDTMTGGAGADVFIFNTAGQTPPGVLRDTITDFASGEDVINLSDFMAGAVLVDRFSATGLMEIRFDAATHRLMGDINGNGLAEWAITLTGVNSISASDLILVV